MDCYCNMDTLSWLIRIIGQIAETGFCKHFRIQRILLLLYCWTESYVRMMQDIAVVLRLMKEGQEGWRLMITRQCNVESVTCVTRVICQGSRVSPCHRCVTGCGLLSLVKLTGKLRKLYAALNHRN